VQLVFHEKFIEFQEWNTELALKYADQVKHYPKKEKNNAKDKWGADSFGGSLPADNDADLTD
jgi:hypothetical protein